MCIILWWCTSERYVLSAEGARADSQQSTVERAVEFTAKYIAGCDGPESVSEDAEEFNEKAIQAVLALADVEDKAVRFRVCMLVSKVFGSPGVYHSHCMNVDPECHGR